MTQPPRPISESYWVQPGRFLAGEYPGAYEAEFTRKRIDRFVEAGFDTFIDLTRPGELSPYKDVLLAQASAYAVSITYDRFSIGDFGVPTPELMNQILDKLEERLEAGHTIYLHCWGGIGRTGTTVGCYLVRQGKTAEQALDQLAAWWRTVPKSRYHRHSPETQEQVEFIRRWAQHDGKLQNTHK